jgi:hypothetical protein
MGGRRWAAAGDDAGMPRARTGGGHPTQAAGGRGRWRFLLRYLELVAAMLIGMTVLGVALRGALALAGLRYPTQYAELVALEMAVTGSVGMAAWMRHRGHGWASTLEMVGALFAPAVALVPLLWLGVIAGDALLVLEHLVMLPLIFLVMLRRRAEYQGSAHG